MVAYLELRGVLQCEPVCRQLLASGETQPRVREQLSGRGSPVRVQVQHAMYQLLRLTRHRRPVARLHVDLALVDPPQYVGRCVVRPVRKWTPSTILYVYSQQG